MIAILWRYRVKPEHREEFERTYGSEGAWAQLFRRHPGYRGTELLAETHPVRPERSESEFEGRSPTQTPDDSPLTYLTIDRWRSEADFADFLATRGQAYAALDAATEGWTEEEEKLGVWEATVLTSAGRSTE